jgi:hypothetical protein
LYTNTFFFIFWIHLLCYMDMDGGGGSGSGGGGGKAFYERGTQWLLGFVFCVFLFSSSFHY